MADFSKYVNYDANTSPFQSVIFSSSSPVLEVELNELQSVMYENMKRLMKEFIGNRVSDASKITFNTVDGLVISYCSILVDGFLIKCENIKDTSIRANDNVFINVTLSEVTVNSTLRKNGYVDGSIIPNTIKDTRYPLTETTRRFAIEYSIDNQATVGCTASLNLGKVTAGGSFECILSDTSATNNLPKNTIEELKKRGNVQSHFYTENAYVKIPTTAWVENTCKYFNADEKLQYPFMTTINIQGVLESDSGDCALSYADTKNFGRYATVPNGFVIEAHKKPTIETTLMWIRIDRLLSK